MCVNYYIIIFLISIYFSFSVGQIHNEEYALNDETDYVMNKHPGLDGNATAPAVNITEQPMLPCKQESVSRGGSTPRYSMDDVSLNHYGTQKINSTGHRTHFELHFAVQTDGAVGIWLSEKEHFSNMLCRLSVGADSNQRMRLFCNGKTVQTIDTPGILSSTEFRGFYIKINHGKLQFGKEGETPLLCYSDAEFVSLHYYKFSTWNGSTNIRYCPAAI